MKKITGLTLIALLFVYACGNGGEKKDESTAENKEGDSTVTEEKFGAEINDEGAQDASTVIAALEKADSVKVKLTGTVNQVCQVKGCWMTMDIGEGKTMRVKFKDYAFFVPKDASGKTAVMEGWAYKEEVSEEMRKHLAEDNGDSAEDIAKITGSKVEYTFMADGVILR